MKNNIKKSTSKKPIQSKKLAIVDHARIDPSHCLVDGLFKPLLRGSEKLSELHVSYKSRNSKFILNWSGPETLNIGDQSTFLAIHRLAVQPERAIRVSQNDSNPLLSIALEELHFSYQAETLDCLAIITTSNEIASITGRKLSGQAKIRIWNTLDRLSKVTLSIYEDTAPTSVIWQSRLVSAFTSDKTLVIGINPMLARAIIQGPSTFIDMREQRLLQSDASKRLHAWLSSWLGANRICEERKIKLDTLIPHVWGDIKLGDAQYSRRVSLLSAVDEIDNLEGWSCKHDKATNDIVLQRQPVKMTVEHNSTKTDLTDGITGLNEQKI